MRNLLLFLFVYGISVLDAWSQNNASQGSFYLGEQQFGKAKSWFLEELKKSPNDVNSLIGLGDAYLFLDSADSAKLLFQKAATINPKNPFALVGLGKVALLNKDRISESDYFDRARRVDKMNPEVYCTIVEGCINLSRQDTVTALIILNQGLSVDQKHANLHLVTGNLETVKKNYGLAMNAFDRAIFFDPKLATAYRNKGRIDMLSHAYADGLKAFNKSIEINPNQILVYKYLGDLLYSASKYSDAERAYNAYRSRTELSLDDKEQFAFILFFNKKYDESAKVLEQVLAVNHDESVLLRIRGYISCETGDYQKGYEYMNKFFALHNPQKLIATDFYYYAKILQNLGKDSLAMENLKNVLALDPGKTEVYEELAKLAAKNRKHKEAAMYYQKMTEKGANKLVYSYLIGKEYYFEGEMWKSRFDSLQKRQKANNYTFVDSSTVKAYMKIYFSKADSAFTVVNQLSSQYAGGFIWKGRMQSILDPQAESTGAKEAYQRALAILQKGDLAKNRNSIIECYKYLGSWYFLAYEKLYPSDKQRSAEMRSKSIDYFNKISELDPNDTQAKEVLIKFKVK